MALIRAAEVGNVMPVAELLGKLETMQSGGVVTSVKKDPPIQDPVPKPGVSKKVKSEAIRKTVTDEVSEKPIQQPQKAVKSRKIEESVKEEPVEMKAPPQQTNEEIEPENVVQPPTREVRKNWDEFIEYVMDRKKWMAHTLRLCANVREEGTDLILKFDEPSDCKMLQTKENIKFLTEFSQDFFQKEFKIVIKIRGADSQGIIDQDEVGPQEERRALANDPLVQMATEVLGGRVVNIRTGPRSR
jgi:DNA polymerase-3 subunit gamma/tau